MTVDEFIYKYYFPFQHTKETIFRLAKQRTDIKNYTTLYYGATNQPTFLYNKIVVKFWIEEADSEQTIIWILYK